MTLTLAEMAVEVLSTADGRAKTALSHAHAARWRQARAAGYARAGLSTLNHNESGLALYRALGFATVPPFKTHPNPDLVYLGRTLDTEGATA